jgi:hypothetical protein
MLTSPQGREKKVSPSSAALTQNGIFKTVFSYRYLPKRYLPTGGISLQALRAALTQNGIVKTEAEVEALFRAVDADSNAYIDFEVQVKQVN